MTGPMDTLADRMRQLVASLLRDTWDHFARPHHGPHPRDNGPMPDFAIIGGGIIGLTIARELAIRGAEARGWLQEQLAKASHELVVQHIGHLLEKM